MRVFTLLLAALLFAALTLAKPVSADSGFYRLHNATVLAFDSTANTITVMTDPVNGGTVLAFSTTTRCTIKENSSTRTPL